MTIFVNNNVEKKENSDDAPPEVVGEVKLLVNDEKKVAPPVPAPLIAVRRPAYSRRYVLLKLCAVLLVIVLLLVLLFVGVTIYHKAKHPELFRGRCGVRYYDLQPDFDPAPSTPGEFEQQVTIDDFFHERIEVPSIGDTRRATVLHDFSRNVTAVVDNDQAVCFIMPLNRTLVKPPKSFWDMMVKLKSGYYIPDVKVVHENYRAVTPPLRDISSLGFNIWMECSDYDTYKLVREGEPVAMSKRSVEWCKFRGNQWCLGDGGGPQMECLTVTGCL